MGRPKSNKDLTQLSGWGALMLGVGALFASDAQASRSDVELSERAASGVRTPAGAHDQVLIRTEGGKVYVSQGGGAFRELSVGDTPEGAYLKQLLGELGAAGSSISVPVGSIVVANGGSGLPGNKPSEATGHRAKKSGGKKSAPRAKASTSRS